MARIEEAWKDLSDAYAGLTAMQMSERGVAGEWSVKDVLGHVSLWEQEALAHLPTVTKGGRVRRYKSLGGIDAFNARAATRKQGWSLKRVLSEMEQTHARLVEYVGEAGGIEGPNRGRFVKRLRLDTHGHYALHGEMIRAWRKQRGI